MLRVCSWAAPVEKLGGEFLGYKQVAPLGQGNRTEVDLVAQGMFMGRTDGETGCRLQTGCPAGAQGYRTEVDLVAQDIFMGRIVKLNCNEL